MIVMKNKKIIIKKILMTIIMIPSWCPARDSRVSTMQSSFVLLDNLFSDGFSKIQNGGKP